MTLKKVSRIILIVLSILTISFIALLSYVHFNRDKLVNLFIAEANKTLKTKIQVEKIDLTIFTRFPEITIDVYKPIVFEAIENSNDTLLSANKIYLSFNVFQLIKGQYSIQKCFLEDGKAHLKVDKYGKNNYEIFETNDEDDKEEENALSFSLKLIQAKNMRIIYDNRQIEQYYHIHTALSEADLQILDNIINIGLNGDTYVHELRIGESVTIKNKNCGLQTVLQIDNNKNGEIVIEPSQLFIENSSFGISGQISPLDKATLVDIAIEESHSNIHTLMALLPADIVDKVKDYKSEGKVYLKGTIKGYISDTDSPHIHIDFGFDDTRFYDPNTKQTIKKAFLKGAFTNGRLHKASTSKLTLREFKGEIEGSHFVADLELNNFDNPDLKFALEGEFPVAMLINFLPNDNIETADGTLRINIGFTGNINELKRNPTSNRIKTDGEIAIENLSAKLKGRKLMIQNVNGDFLFNKTDLAINELVGKIGSSDFSFQGYFRNFISYILLDNQPLIMDADFYSNYIDLDEMLAQQEVANSAATQAGASDRYHFGISTRLEYKLNCEVRKLKFRNIKEKYTALNLTVGLKLKDQVVHYDDLRVLIADGSFNSYGSLNAKDNKKIVLDMHSKASRIDVEKLLYVLENCHQEFITDKNLKGQLFASISGKYIFNDQLDLDLSSMYTLAEITIDNGQLLNFEPMVEMEKFLKDKKYNKYLKNDDLSVIQFSQLKNALKIENNTIHIPQMTIATSAIDIDIMGTHTFDSKIDYAVNFPLINYKKRGNNDDEDAIEEKGGKEFRIYLKVKGTTENYNISLDKGKSLKSATQKIGDEIKQTLQRDNNKIKYLGVEETDTTDYIDFDDL